MFRRRDSPDLRPRLSRGRTVLRDPGSGELTLARWPYRGKKTRRCRSCCSGYSHQVQRFGNSRPPAKPASVTPSRSDTRMWPRSIRLTRRRGVAYVVARPHRRAFVHYFAEKGALSPAHALTSSFRPRPVCKRPMMLVGCMGTSRPAPLLSQTRGGYSDVKLIGFTQESSSRRDEAIDTGSADRLCKSRTIVGQPPDPRSDVFSLGPVLYTALTGAPPTTSRQDEKRPDGRG